MSSRRILATFLAAALVSVCMAPVFAQPILGPSSPPEQPQAPSMTAPDIGRMMERAQQSGSVRVIVGLRMDTRPEGELSSEARVAQRSNISAAQDSVMSRLSNARVTREYETIPFLALDVDEEQLNQLLSLPNVTSIVPDGIGDTSLDRSTRVVKAHKLWNRSITGSDWAVAVLDTGIKYNHAAFDRARIVASACFSTTNTTVLSLCPNGVTKSTHRRSAADCDISIPGCGHGTHVAATVAGAQNNRFRGAAPDANLIPIQIFSRFSGNSCSGGGFCARYYYSDLIAALDHVLTLSDTHQIAAVNMSLQGGRFAASCDTFLPAFTQIASNLTSRGVLLVAAAGNSFWTGEYAHPACDPWVVAVGATDDNDVVASFSNLTNFGPWLMAPGVAIEAAYPPNRRNRSNLSGTSMAAPHVAGAAALLRSERPLATASEIFDALYCTGVPVTRAGFGTSHPRIVLPPALRALVRGTTC